VMNGAGEVRFLKAGATESANKQWGNLVNMKSISKESY
jgi:hypothetical protein